MPKVTLTIHPDRLAVSLPLTPENLGWALRELDVSSVVVEQAPVLPQEDRETIVRRTLAYCLKQLGAGEMPLRTQEEVDAGWARVRGFARREPPAVEGGHQARAIVAMPARPVAPPAAARAPARTALAVAVPAPSAPTSPIGKVGPSEALSRMVAALPDLGWLTVNELLDIVAGYGWPPQGLAHPSKGLALALESAVSSGLWSKRKKDGSRTVQYRPGAGRTR